MRDNFPTWVADHFIGKRVAFTLCGHPMTGTVIESERFYLVNGTHDILTVELDDEPKQVRVQMYRQAVRLMEELYDR